MTIDTPVQVPRSLALLVAASALAASPGCGAPAPDEGDSEGLDSASHTASKAPPAAAAPKPGAITFARDSSERANAVRIRDEPYQKPTVIYSVRLPSVSSAEQLLARGEVMISRCNDNDIGGGSRDGKDSPCTSKQMRNSPYGYNPRFSAALALGSSPTDAGGPLVSKWVSTVCSKNDHHCALAIPEALATDLPDAAEAYLNLIVTADANGSDAKKWHVGDVEQKRGSLAVTRLGPGHSGAPAFEKSSKKLLRTKGMSIDRPAEDGDEKRGRWLLYQVKLDGLQPGDVVDADGRMRALLGGYDCDPFMMGELILTSDPTAREVEQKSDEALTVKNGGNCANHSKKGCSYAKSGAARLGKNTPSTMYLSYVVTALRSCAAKDGSDKWHADADDGFLKASVRR